MNALETNMYTLEETRMDSEKPLYKGSKLA